MNSTTVIGIVLLTACATRADEKPPAVPPDVMQAAKRISSEALRKHVTYLASDQLKGRANGTPGLDAAADYIAGEFRRAGLKPAGTDQFFQRTETVLVAPNFKQFEVRIRGAGLDVSAQRDEILVFSRQALNFSDVPVIKVDPDDSAAIAALTPDVVRGKVVMMKIITKGESAERWANSLRVLSEIDKLKPLLLFNYGPMAAKSDIPGVFEAPGAPHTEAVPHFPIRTAALRAALEKMAPGLTPLRVTVRLQEPLVGNAGLRNVAGILPGSDGDSGGYVVVTAYYDGAYMRRGDPDPVLHSANANASGVAALIETARVLAGLKNRPRSSILFLALAGEAPASLGAKYYIQYPLVPIGKTVGCVNLVNLGRIDSTEGPLRLRAAVTGDPLSMIPRWFSAAGLATGVTIYDDHKRDAVNSGSRGFRPMLLDSGVPSHTVYVAFDFPDANKASDVAEKLDYENMARVDGMIAAGLFLAADAKTPSAGRP